MGFLASIYHNWRFQPSRARYYSSITGYSFSDYAMIRSTVNSNINIINTEFEQIAAPYFINSTNESSTTNIYGLSVNNYIGNRVSNTERGMFNLAGNVVIKNLNVTNSKIWGRGVWNTIEEWRRNDYVRYDRNDNAARPGESSATYDLWNGSTEIRALILYLENGYNYISNGLHAPYQTTNHSIFRPLANSNWYLDGEINIKNNETSTIMDAKSGTEVIVNDKMNIESNTVAYLANNGSSFGYIFSALGTNETHIVFEEDSEINIKNNTSLTMVLVTYYILMLQAIQIIL